MHTHEEDGAPPPHPAPVLHPPSLLSLPEAPGGDPSSGLKGPAAVRLPPCTGPSKQAGVGGDLRVPGREGAHWEGLDGPHDLTVLGHPLDAAHCRLELG